MASYPGSIATFTAVTDTTGTIAVDHAGLHNQANGEVVAIETTLGVNAQGTDGTVAAKLIRIDGQSSGTGYVPTTFQLNGLTLSGASATLSSTQVACIGTGSLSTDGSMASQSNSLVPSQKAVVTYVASQSTNAGTVTNVSSANADIQIANPTTTPVATLNSGTAANQIVKLNSSSQIPAVDGSLLTKLIGSITNYGSSSTAGSAVSLANLKIAYGAFSLTGVSNPIVGLPFSSTGYSVSLAYTSTASLLVAVSISSGTAFNILSNFTGSSVYWIAIGT